jgi:hypothetical protein
VDITKIDRLASVLFPGTNWTDKDSDNRVDTDELSPSANSSFLGRIGVSARIRNKHRPLIANIDKDGNGASLDEIEEHIISKEGLLCDIDPKKVLSALRKDGIYWTGNRKMIFIRQDKAQNAFELRQTNARVKALIAKFNVATVFSSKDSAPFGN